MITNTLDVKFPRDLAFALKMKDKEFEGEIRKMAVVKLYELGKISSGKAAVVLGLSRIQFLEMLATYKVSVFSFSETEDLKNDRANA